MIYINLSFFDTVIGPQTFCTLPSPPEEDIEEYTNTLLNISEFIELKFFVYVSSEHLKTSNIYTKIPSEWARGKMEMVLLSILLVDEEFSRLFIFEEVLEKFVTALKKVDNAYMAFHLRDKADTHEDAILTKKKEIMSLLEGFLPEINEIIETAKKIPTDSEIIETEENLQDEFVILNQEETVLEASKKLASSPRVLIGVVLDGKKLVGIVDENDVLNKVILRGKEPLIVKVRDIMTTEVVCVDSNDPIEEVIDDMLEKGIQAVPIIQNAEFYGVFTIFDAAGHNQTVLELIGEQLEEISQRKLDDAKKLKVKLWSSIRNISRNKRLQELHKKA